MWHGLWQSVVALFLALPLLTTAAGAPRAAEGSGDKQAMTEVFDSLVGHAFGPGNVDHADIYYRTRFFTAHMQSRMRFIMTQYDDQSSAARSEDLALTQSEADQLNEVAQELWLASRKLYQSWGCLSYDLTLCSGATASKGTKLTEGQRSAMAAWERRLETQFAPKKALSRDEANEIHDLAKEIQTVLLAETTI
ncbi:hypothetical protein GGF46_003123 [Coemansia sp. RSA 552]|nr:hypothetical protein GGF46_003123 [Coemansia sp. RSA 552]